MSSGLVLSLFPGIGLLDMAFEEEGFCVVRGPDLLWGGDIKRFNPPPGTFAGVIGGPPCQAHSRLANLARAQGHTVAEDMIPEWIRVVGLARPTWWLMENVIGVPEVNIEGYRTTSILLDNRWLDGGDGIGLPQSRRRRFQFGSAAGSELQIESLATLNNPVFSYCCLAVEGHQGEKSVKGKRITKRTWAEFCGLQGLPDGYLEDAPLTIEGKYRMVGNGVPLPMGRAVAVAVSRAVQP